MLKHMMNLASDRIGICIDTAWCLQSSENPVKWLEIFNKRIYAVHYKDYVFDRSGHFTDAIVGRGTLDLPAFLRGLIDLDINGPVVVEYEGDPDDPVPALTECVREIQRVDSNLTS